MMCDLGSSEILIRLDGVNMGVQHSHEENGVLYSAYGALYFSISDEVEAKRYYEKAQREFLITNSLHLKEVNIMLGQLQ